MSAEKIIVNGRELTVFDLPSEPTDEYTVNVDGLGEITVRKGEQPSERDVPAEYMRKMVTGLCEQNASLYRENAKLRELCKDMWGWELHGCGACNLTEAADCDTDIYSSYCLMREMLADRMRELGIEVGE